jgi:hypothetical protein
MLNNIRNNVISTEILSIAIKTTVCAFGKKIVEMILVRPRVRGILQDTI